ncbi:hypothetical protein ACCS33_36715, partial [Rhizobium ruizarguesonis]
MKKTAPLRQEDYEALADLRFALRQFMDFSASAAQSEGLPAQQHQALLAIRGQRGDAMTIGIQVSTIQSEYYKKYFAAAAEEK